MALGGHARRPACGLCQRSRNGDFARLPGCPGQHQSRIPAWRRTGLVNVSAGTIAAGVQVGLRHLVKSDAMVVQAGLINVNGPCRRIERLPGWPGQCQRQRGNVRRRHGGAVNVGRKVQAPRSVWWNVRGEVEGAQVGLVNFARKNRVRPSGFYPSSGRLQPWSAWYSDQARSMSAPSWARGTCMCAGRRHDPRIAIRTAIASFHAPSASAPHNTGARSLVFDVDLTNTQFATNDDYYQEKAPARQSAPASWLAVRLPLPVVAGPR